MDTPKPKAVKNVGLTIAILSGLVIFSNAMGALMFTLLGFNDYETIETSDLTALDYFFNNISNFLLILVVIGVLFFIGGIQLMKYKLWAKRYLVVLSLILISLLTLLLSSAVYSAITNSEIVFGAILILIIWIGFSVPLLLLIRFLNKSR